MDFLTPDFVPSAEAFRAHARHAGSPRSEALRICGVAMMTTMGLGWTRLGGAVDFAPLVRVEFALSGFLVVDMLMGSRVKPESIRARLAGEKPSAWMAFWRTFPASQLLGLILTILLAPRILALESVSVTELGEMPAAVAGCLRSNLGEYLDSTFVGQSLIAWPIFLALAPARLLGLGGLTLVGGGLMVLTTVFLGSHAGPASILVNPSPVDLVSAGALVGAILQGFGRSEDGPLARCALLAGIALAGASVASRFGLCDSGTSLSVLSAPPGYGALNFILELIATTLIGSLIWRDVDALNRDGLG